MPRTTDRYLFLTMRKRDGDSSRYQRVGFFCGWKSNADDDALAPQETSSLRLVAWPHFQSSPRIPIATSATEKSVAPFNNSTSGRPTDSVAASLYGFGGPGEH
jgi:hypothetical protein